MSVTYNSGGGFLSNETANSAHQTFNYASLFGLDGQSNFPQRVIQEWKTSKVFPQSLLGVELPLPGAAVIMQISKHLEDLWFLGKICPLETDDAMSYITQITTYDDSPAEKTSVFAPTHESSSRTESVAQHMNFYGKSLSMALVTLKEDECQAELLNKIIQISNSIMLSIMRDTLDSILQTRHHFYKWASQAYYPQRSLDQYIMEETTMWNVVVMHERGIHWLLSYIDSIQNINRGKSNSVIIAADTQRYIRNVKKENALNINVGSSTVGYRNKYDSAEPIDTVQGNNIYALQAFIDSMKRVDDPLREHVQNGEFHDVFDPNEDNGPELFTIRDVHASIYCEEEDMNIEKSYADMVNGLSVFDTDGSILPVNVGINQSGNGYEEDKYADFLSRPSTSGVPEPITLNGELRGLSGSYAKKGAAGLKNLVKRFYSSPSEVDRIYENGISLLKRLETVPFDEEDMQRFIDNNQPHIRKAEAHTEKRSKLVAGNDRPVQLLVHENTPFYKLGDGNQNVITKLPFGSASLWGLEGLARCTSFDDSVKEDIKRAKEFVELFNRITSELKSVFPVSDVLDERNAPLAVRQARAAHSLFVNALMPINCFAWIRSAAPASAGGVTVLDLDELQATGRLDQIASDAADLPGNVSQSLLKVLDAFDYYSNANSDDQQAQMIRDLKQIEQYALTAGNDTIQGRPLGAVKSRKGFLFLAVQTLAHIQAFVVINAIRGSTGPSFELRTQVASMARTVLRAAQIPKMDIIGFLVRYSIKDSNDMASRERAQLVEVIKLLNVTSEISVPVLKIFDDQAREDGDEITLSGSDKNADVTAEVMDKFIDVFAKDRDTGAYEKAREAALTYCTRVFTVAPCDAAPESLVSLCAEAQMPGALKRYKMKHQPAIRRLFTKMTSSLIASKDANDNATRLAGFYDVVLKHLIDPTTPWTPQVLTDAVNDGSFKPEWLVKSSSGKNKTDLLAAKIEQLLRRFAEDMDTINQAYEIMKESASNYDGLVEMLAAVGGADVNLADYVQTSMSFSTYALGSLVDFYRRNNGSRVPVLCSSPANENVCGSLDDLFSLFEGNNQSMVRPTSLEQMEANCELLDLYIPRHVAAEGLSPHRQSQSTFSSMFSSGYNTYNPVIRASGDDSRTVVSGAISNAHLLNFVKELAIGNSDLTVLFGRTVALSAANKNNWLAMGNKNIAPLIEFRLFKPWMRYDAYALIKIQDNGEAFKTNIGLPCFTATTLSDQQRLVAQFKCKGGPLMVDVRNVFVARHVHVCELGGGASAVFYDPKAMMRDGEDYLNPQAGRFGGDENQSKASIIVTAQPLGAHKEGHKIVDIRGRLDNLVKMGLPLTKLDKSLQYSTAWRTCTTWNIKNTGGNGGFAQPRSQDVVEPNTNCLRGQTMLWNRATGQFDHLIPSLSHWGERGTYRGARKARAGQPYEFPTKTL